MAAQKQGNTIDISKPIRDVAHAIARRSAAKERARQFDQRMALQKAKFQHQSQRDNANTKLAQDKQTHKVAMDYQKNKDNQAKLQLAQDKLQEAKTARKTKNKMNSWKIQNQQNQHKDKMKHAKNVLAEKTEHDKASELIKAQNRDTFKDDVANKTNLTNAKIEKMRQDALINQNKSGVKSNQNAYQQSQKPKSQTYDEVISSIRPQGSSLGGKVGPKDTAHGGVGKSMAEAIAKGNRAL